jgi:predicted xylose isomerase-like sugar epimerase
VNSIASDNENSPTKGFLNDFEMLLNLQLKLENEALSTLSMMDCSNSAKAIGRLSKEEVCQLVWNIFQHLHSAEKKLISEETARLVHGIICNQV